MESTNEHPNAQSVVIAVLTYLRPEGLDEIVPRLVEQAASVDSDVSVLVIDNDPTASAMNRASHFPPDLVRFVHEPKPGIAAARNRAFDESTDKRLLVFIDDDEVPQEKWLANLVKTWEETRAAAVVGPVVSTFPEDPDPWILAGGFFNRRRLPTGTLTDIAATNNLLLDMDMVRSLGLRFDDRFGVTGGSDTLFTKELSARGGPIVWCDEAVVVDVVPSDRMTREWVLRRRFRLGNGLSRVTIALETSAARRFVLRLRLTMMGMARVVAGAARLGAGYLLRSMKHQANGSRTLSRGLGIVSGAWGFKYAEYQRDKSG